MQAPSSELMTRTEAAEMLRVPPRTLADWALRGVGPRYYKVGRHVRYLPSDLRDWLAAQAVTPR